MTQSDQSSIDREIATDYILERLDEIKQMVSDLLETVEREDERDNYVPTGGLSAVEAIITATFAAERKWWS